MALHPNSFNKKEILQPGGRGERFIPNQAGYHDGDERINRTATRLNISDHDVLNIKYEFDYRLPVLFRYGYGFGFNQMVITKGRIVSADKNMDLVNFESQKQFNTLTLANGGVPVKLRENGDLYKDSFASEVALVSPSSQGKQVANVGKEWAPLIGMEDAYTDIVMRPFAVDGPTAQLDDAGFKIDPTTGVVVNKLTNEIRNDIRSANIPLGMLERNEYTRDDNAYNGMMPGPVVTDKLVELPWFAYKDKAESNPWGSIYGNLFVGALLKSDENGRVTISPLSHESIVATMSISEYELERQQLIGQVYAVNHELVPEGAAKWTVWALEDRENFEAFMPTLWRANNRRGEDSVNSSPFNASGKYPGYPYDKVFTRHDLHMLASTARKDNYDLKMNLKYQYDNLGIPGLTDGYNAVVRDIPETKVGVIHYAGDKATEYEKMSFTMNEVNLEQGSVEISINGSAYVNCIEGATLLNDTFKVFYANDLQAFYVLEVIDKAKADALLKPEALGVEVKMKAKKRGLSGVPTFMDWDGVVGSCKILLQK